MPDRPPLLTCIAALWLVVGALLVPLQIWVIRLQSAQGVVGLIAIAMLLGAVVLGPGMMVVGGLLLRRSRDARMVALLASGGMCLSAAVALACVRVFVGPLVHYQSGGVAELEDYLLVLGPVVVGLAGPPTWGLLLAGVANSFPGASVPERAASPKDQQPPRRD